MSAVSDWIATTAGDYANLVDVSWILRAQEGTVSDLMQSTPWDEMSVAVLHSVAALLHESSMQQIRLVFKAWKQAATFAINTLRPNMTGSLGLQCQSLPSLQSIRSEVIQGAKYQRPAFVKHILHYSAP